MALACSAALIAFAVAARFVDTVSRIDTGWLLVAEQWKAGTIDSLYPEEAVANREPPEQADYWLRETDRILAESETSARLAMGAAWILDAPAQGFKAKHLQTPQLPMLPPTLENTERLEQVFEARCGPRCLELARRGVELEPANVDWRRMQALLTVRSPSSSFRQEARTNQWVELLDEAARRDRDNALYDYLAALFLWSTSADYQPAPTTSTSTISYSISVHAPQQFTAGVARFEQGQKKKFLAVGEAGLSAIVGFLSRSRLTIAGQDKVASGSNCVLRAQSLIIALMRWQMARSDHRAVAGDAAEALTLAEQRLRLLDQIEAAGEWTANDLNYEAYRQQTFRRMVELSQENEGLLTAKARDDLVRNWRQAMVRYRVRQAAAQLAAKPPAAPLTIVDFLAASVLALAPTSMVILLCVGVLCWSAALALGRGEQCARPLPAWQHPIAWGIAWSASFAVLGMAPAEFVSRETQCWLALTLIAFLPAMVFGLLLWRSRFRFSLRAAFVAMFVCAVLCLPWAELARRAMLRGAVQPLLIPPLGAENLDAATWLRMARVAPQSWTAAAWQWLMHWGPWYAAIECPLLVAAWSALRRTAGGGQAARVPGCAWWSVVVRDAGRSAFALAALLLLLHLTILPKVLLRIERHYDEVTQFFLDPHGSYDGFREQIKIVERDAVSMKGFQQAADAEIAALRSPERE